MIAVNTIRREPAFRREAFDNGLRRAGYATVSDRVLKWPTEKQDLLLIWNYHSTTATTAERWERDGGTVVVCENGYVGKDTQGRQYYAIAVHGHNGSGWWPLGEQDNWQNRWENLGLACAEYRRSGKHLLVCGQRGIGSKIMASPPNWHTIMQRNLGKVTDRKIMVRAHPGTAPPPTKLEDDLKDAWACVIWSSGSGVKALLQGIPVFYAAPYWICSGAARKLDVKFLEHPNTNDEDRLAALRKMAWAQWSVDEIESGEPFVRIQETVE